MLPNQVSGDLQRQIVELETDVEATFTSFRGELDGERVADNAILDILRTSDDVGLRRRAWEAYLTSEWNSGGRGEAGWSAEWRKRELSADDVAQRSCRWREYCCESFCDTAAWITGGVDSEVTLGQARRRARLAWFDAHFRGYVFPI